MSLEGSKCFVCFLTSQNVLRSPIKLQYNVFWWNHWPLHDCETKCLSVYLSPIHFRHLNQAKEGKGAKPIWIDRSSQHRQICRNQTSEIAIDSLSLMTTNCTYMMSQPYRSTSVNRNINLQRQTYQYVICNGKISCSSGHGMGQSS